MKLFADCTRKELENELNLLRNLYNKVSDTDCLLHDEVEEAIDKVSSFYFDVPEHDDSPEWTEEMFANAKPSSEMLPKIFGKEIAAQMLKPKYSESWEFYFCCTSQMQKIVKDFSVLIFDEEVFNFVLESALYTKPQLHEIVMSKKCLDALARYVETNLNSQDRTHESLKEFQYNYIAGVKLSAFDEPNR